MSVRKYVPLPVTPRLRPRTPASRLRLLSGFRAGFGTSNRLPVRPRIVRSSMLGARKPWPTPPTISIADVSRNSARAELVNARCSESMSNGPVLGSLTTACGWKELYLRAEVQAQPRRHVDLVLKKDGHGAVTRPVGEHAFGRLTARRSSATHRRAGWSSDRRRRRRHRSAGAAARRGLVNWTLAPRDRVRSKCLNSMVGAEAAIRW